MMNIMVICSLLIAITPVYVVQAFAFQQQSTVVQVPRSVNARSSVSPPSATTTTALNVKFRLDNDDEQDDENETPFSTAKNQQQQKSKRTLFYDDNGNADDDTLQSQQQQYENEYESKAPATTFGAEAVPEGQRPANEYMELLASPLFDWANREPNGDIGLLAKLGLLYVGLFGIVCWPISGATFTTEGYEMHKFFSSNVGAIGFVLVIILRLYTGWGYVGSRLQSKGIEFEETGWYDGDIELKTDAEMARDLFLYRESVQPVVERLQKFSLITGSLWIASCIGLNVAFNSKPVFNEYDPEMLKMLNYDDKIAGVAAQQSGGRPTYCDSRYYRAVANGGQGC